MVTSAALRIEVNFYGTENQNMPQHLFACFPLPIHVEWTNEKKNAPNRDKMLRTVVEKSMEFLKKFDFDSLILFIFITITNSLICVYQPVHQLGRMVVSGTTISF